MRRQDIKVSARLTLSLLLGLALLDRVLRLELLIDTLAVTGRHINVCIARVLLTHSLIG